MSEEVKEKNGKIVELDKDAHIMIKNKQNEIFNKTNKTMPLRIIASEAIKKGINLIEI